MHLRWADKLLTASSGVRCWGDINTSMPHSGRIFPRRRGTENFHLRNKLYVLDTQATFPWPSVIPALTRKQGSVSSLTWLVSLLHMKNANICHIALTTFFHSYLPHQPSSPCFRNLGQRLAQAVLWPEREQAGWLYGMVTSAWNWALDSEGTITHGGK